MQMLWLQVLLLSWCIGGCPTVVGGCGCCCWSPVAATVGQLSSVGQHCLLLLPLIVLSQEAVADVDVAAPMPLTMMRLSLLLVAGDVHHRRRPKRRGHKRLLLLLVLLKLLGSCKLWLQLLLLMMIMLLLLLAKCRMWVQLLMLPHAATAVAQLLPVFAADIVADPHDVATVGQMLYAGEHCRLLQPLMLLSQDVVAVVAVVVP